MLITHTQLAPATLRAIVQEFVTRDGTDHSSVEKRIAGVTRQLKNGRLELHFDPESESCSIVPVEFGFQGQRKSTKKNGDFQN